jgi:hypothetical protein
VKVCNWQRTGPILGRVVATGPAIGNSILLFVAEGVKAKVYFRARAHHVKGRTFLQVEDMKMDFSVKDIKMGIENLHNGNTVLRKCLTTWQSLIFLMEDVLLLSADMFVCKSNYFTELCV